MARMKLLSREFYVCSKNKFPLKLWFAKDGKEEVISREIATEMEMNCFPKN
jgi:hypothetical protein